MRTVFLGTPEIAVPSLAAVSARHEVTAVVCQPDQPRGRSGKAVPPEVKVWALDHGLPVHQPVKLHDGSFAEWLRAQAPEICVVAAYGRLLKQPVLDVPPQGWLNVHPSLLPRWRGPSPIRTAILEGDTVTGVSIIRIILEMDAGDIALQESTPIDPGETAGELAQRLGEMGARLLLEAMDQTASGAIRFTPQDPDQVTKCKLFTKEDGRIRWRQPARRIFNLVRAANPWPVAHTLFNGEICRIHRAAVVDTPAAADPGVITAVLDDRIQVATGEGELAILEFQVPGKRVLPMDAFLRGRTMTPGERFEDIT